MPELVKLVPKFGFYNLTMCGALDIIGERFCIAPVSSSESELVFLGFKTNIWGRCMEWLSGIFWCAANA